MIQKRETKVNINCDINKKISLAFREMNINYF